MSLRHWKILIICATILLLIVAIYLFIKDQILFRDTPIDTNKFGQFGDFVAGLLSGLTIFLLLLTYFFTLESNEVEKVERYYQSLNSEIAEAFYKDKKGVEAYLNYKFDSGVDNVILDHVNLVISSFDTYLKLLQENKFLKHGIKEKYITRFYLLYYSKVLWPLHITFLEVGKKIITEDKHDDSKIILPKYADLGIRSIQHLKENNIIIGSKWKENTLSKLVELKSLSPQNSK
jgi:hypothetical protein